MDASCFSIESNASDRELVFLEPQPVYSIAGLRGTSVAAARKVYASTDARGLAGYFSRLASYQRPWSTVERRESSRRVLDSGCTLFAGRSEILGAYS